MDELRRARVLYVGLCVLVVLACLFLLYELRGVWQHVGSILGSVLTPFLISVIIAYLLHPLVARLQGRGVPRGASIVIIYIVFFVLVALFLINTIPLFIDQLRDLSEGLPQVIAQAEKWVDGIHEDKKHWPEAVRKAVDSNLAGLEVSVSQAISGLLQKIGNAAEGMTGWLVVPFLVFYMLKDIKVIERALFVLFPKQNRQGISRLLKSIDDALGSYIRGQLLVAFLVGLLSYIGYLIVSMPFALLLAMILAITNIIPYIGPFIGAAPALLLALTVSPMMMLKVLIVNLIVQQLEGNVISPYMIGKSLKLHPMLIILALLLGGELFGMVGLILAIPFVAVLKVILQHLLLHSMKR